MWKFNFKNPKIFFGKKWKSLPNLYDSSNNAIIRVHNELFGGYEGDLMLKPDEATLYRVRGSFLDFLKREDLEPIKLLLKTSQEMTGS